MYPSGLMPTALYSTSGTFQILDGHIRAFYIITAQKPITEIQPFRDTVDREPFSVNNLRQIKRAEDKLSVHCQLAFRYDTVAFQKISD